jgi:DNA-binding NarL/FixJ family response regulator
VRVVSGPRPLVESLHRVVAGEVVIDPEIVQRVLLRPRSPNPLDRLTDGELRVLTLMAEGRSNNAIARELNFVAGTVEKRITAIGQKLGLPHIDDLQRTGVNVRVLAVLTYLRNIR